VKAIVDRSQCIGCGACAAICPQVFRTDDNGLAEVYVDVVPPEAEAAAQDAADGCPVEAIPLER
jgi:ferredoxin